LAAVVLAGLTAGLVAVATSPGPATADPTDPPPTPTDTGGPTDTPPPPPPPNPGVKVVAGDVSLDNSYWQGSGGRGGMGITVTNLVDTAESVTVSPSLPAGVHLVGSCACTKTVGPNGVWTFSLTVSVDPDAWRHPLSGSVSAVASIPPQPDARDQDGFSVLLTPGPPVPGVSLNANNLVLPAQPARSPETGQLGVRLANTGTVPATAAVEVFTPSGVDVYSFPSACVSHRHVASHRDRCELGQLTAGRDVSLSFGLSISTLARGEAPLSGAVHAFLTPSGQDTAEIQTSFRVLVGTSPDQSAAPGESASASPAGASDPAFVAGGFVATEPTGTTNAPGHGGSSTAPLIIGLVVAMLAVIGAFTFVSLRRRLQDQDETPVPEPRDQTTSWPPTGPDLATWPPADESITTWLPTEDSFPVSGAPEPEAPIIDDRLPPEDDEEEDDAASTW
jgi:hypothetical protein